MIDTCRDIVTEWVGPNVAGDVLKLRMAQAYIDLFEQLEAAQARLNSGIFMGQPVDYWVGLRDALRKIAGDPVGVAIDSVGLSGHGAQEIARRALTSNPATEPHECPGCDGRGWNTVAVHAMECDGNCHHCPVPEQEQCATCGGSGEVQSPASVFPGGGSSVGEKNLRVGQPGYSRIMDAALQRPGPAEDWYCRCRNLYGDEANVRQYVLRQASVNRCDKCGMPAPWAAKDES